MKSGPTAFNLTHFFVQLLSCKQCSSTLSQNKGVFERPAKDVGFIRFT